jgi:hypothetical protein
MQHERDVAADPEGFQQRIEVAGVGGETVPVRSPGGSLAESPIPIRSGARHRPVASKCGITLRHR